MRRRHRPPGEAAGSDEAERAHRRHELRPVDEREPFLGLERDRSETDAGERLRSSDALSVEERIALADQRERQVRERSQVAARSDRASTRDARNEAAVQALEQVLDRLDARAGVALRECVRAEEHRRADDLVRIRIADTRRVTSEEAKLELARQLLRNRLGTRIVRTPC